MAELVTAAEAAEILGVSVHRVREFMRRAEDPLPSIRRVEGGSRRLVVFEEIRPWLRRQAERDRPEHRDPRRLAS
ncbi:MAG: helix-turn-helix domain-containing protein [Acidobacteriota bacterium]|nr:helix-turn-helix domain-containing protein [Acidobacteriota bacterium]